MAGDWIPIRTDLHETPEVVMIAMQTSTDKFYVAGILVRFWSWLQNQSATGNLSGSCPADYRTFLAGIVGGTPEFWSAVADVGWIKQTATGFEIPNYERWLGRGAKVRLLDSRRKAEARASGKSPATVRRLSGSQPDKNRTTGEERRGQKRRGQKRNHDVEHDSSSIAHPHFGGPECIAALQREPAYEGIDVAKEFQKADVWCRKNNRKLTERFFVNWLNRADRPVGAGGNGLGEQILASHERFVARRNQEAQDETE